MGNRNKKLLMSILCLFIAGLIVSTSTTTVTAAENWGTLKAGDEMHWEADFGDYDAKFEVLSVNGNMITMKIDFGGAKETYTINADEYAGTSGGKQTILPLLWSSNELKDFAESQNYEFEGTTYKAYYAKIENQGYAFETWIDFNTGILFEQRITDPDGDVQKYHELISTNADLAEVGGGGCFGTIFIALFSVTAIVSYSLVRYRKKITP